MGYSGGKLRPWFDTGTTKHALMKMADRGGAALHNHIVARTPVDTGHLKSSWKRKPVIVTLNAEGEVVYETGVSTEVGYAPDVEWGTGLWGPKHAKYLIEPKNPGGVLRWIGPDGAPVFARRVWHPGSPGAHMVAISVAETEAELHLLLAPVLEEWRVATEEQNHSGLGASARR